MSSLSFVETRTPDRNILKVFGDIHGKTPTAQGQRTLRRFVDAAALLPIPNLHADDLSALGVRPGPCVRQRFAILGHYKSSSVR